MSIKPLATFSENVFSNNIMLKPADNREYLYAHNEIIYISAMSDIIWLAGDVGIDEIPDMLDKGDRIVSPILMKAIMAWDPYGVIFMPARLVTDKGESKKHYLMAVNNIIPVIDNDASHVFMKDNSRYNLPSELIVSELYISEKKYSNIPECRKHIFRVKGSDDTIFFSTELVSHVWTIAEQNGCKGIIQEAFDFNEEAPGF